MIESITIADIATFGSTPEALIGLSKFNFVFGSNGTGKTTVSRVIAEESSFPTCKVAWKGGTKLQPMVYNLSCHWGRTKGSDCIQEESVL